MTTTTTTHTALSPADRSRLVADVANAGSIAAPYWPLTAFVAVNPLGGLTDLPFADATASARGLVRRPHPPAARGVPGRARPRHRHRCRSRPCDPAPRPNARRTRRPRSRRCSCRPRRSRSLGPAPRSDRSGASRSSGRRSGRRPRRDHDRMVCGVRRRSPHAVADARSRPRLLSVVAGRLEVGSSPGRRGRT